MRRRPSASATDEEDDHLLPNASDRPPDDDNDSDSLDSLDTSADSLIPPPARLDRPLHKSKTGRPTNQIQNHNRQQPRPWPSSAKPGLHGKPLTQKPSGAGLAQVDPRRDVTMAHRARLRSPWAFTWLSLLALLTSALLLLTSYHSFLTRQLDPKGGSMSYMASSFVRFDDFDTEHTRFASKYTIHLYRELGVDEDPRVKGVPVLFIPGNAGSYKQVRSLASEAEYHFQQLAENMPLFNHGAKLGLDFFTVDFNEDFTAFHGQTLVDQAEYLNDAIAYILALYHNPEKSRRDSGLPDPSSVILIGHSMGGVVARTMLTMPNYQTNSVNTIITLSAPHARPPVTFDAQIVDTYKSINEYWRRAHSKKWGMDNPLWHVTVISIAGGGLDTIVPSDYASVSSLVPETHGFTVFTSTIPSVWTGMDHLAITWCDEFRKVVIKALFDVMDARRPAQTKPRGERMRAFKKWFLTGLEDIAERSLPNIDSNILLTLEDPSNKVLAQGEKLVISHLGRGEKRMAHFLPVPPHGSPKGRKFTLLTSADVLRAEATLEVLFCSLFPPHGGHAAALFSMSVENSGEEPPAGSTRLACKPAKQDFVHLPASTKQSRYPFEKTPPFSYLEYELDLLAEFQFVVVVDRGQAPSDEFVIGEFNDSSESQIVTNVTIYELLNSVIHWSIPGNRPLVMDIRIPALESSLLSYHLTARPKSRHDASPLFQPMARQYISDVYESKFFVNLNDADINLHGVAPYMPPSMRLKDGKHGLSFQIWSDPTSATPLELSLTLDIPGSFGKLWMRYRTFFATLPLVVVALVMAKQFKVYDETGIFMSFAEGLNQCIRREIPILLSGLIFCAALLSNSEQPLQPTPGQPHWFDKYKSNATESVSDFTMNNLLLGSSDPVFWYLIPIFGVMSTGMCVAINYAVLGIECLLAIPASFIKFGAPKPEDSRRPGNSFAITTTRRRVITTSILLALVATVLPYQFAYLVLCIVQVVTSVRALLRLGDTRTDYMYNFYNFSHSVLVLMLWILPINVPVLVVWIRNLALHWLTPFSTHHNILSIVPFILLVETNATGKIVPRVSSGLRHGTTAILLVMAFYAAIYGLSYAYALHQVANVFCAWLVLILWFSGSLELEKTLGNVVSGSDEGSDKKTP